MMTEARIKEVMRDKCCDYRSACSWLGRRGVAKRAAVKRRRSRVAMLQSEADRQEAEFQKIKRARPDLY